MMIAIITRDRTLDTREQIAIGSIFSFSVRFYSFYPI